MDRFRPVEIVAPGFVAVTADQVPADEPPTIGATACAAKAAHRPRSPRWRSGAGHGCGSSIAAGLATADDQHVLVRWAAATGLVTLEVRRAGRPGCSAASR